MKSLYRNIVKRRTLSASVSIRSVNIFKEIENDPDFQKAQVIMLYWSLGNEITTHEIISKWHETKTVLLPSVIDQYIVPKIFSGIQNMRSGSYGILEPTGSNYEGPIDYIIVPGMAFDKELNRLGRGGGYYDRFLSQYLAVKKVSMCRPWQLFETLPTEEHDIKIDKLFISNT